VRKMLAKLDPVATSPEVYESHLVEGLVQRIKYRSVFAFLQSAVVEGQTPVLDRHDHLPRPAQDVNIQSTFLIRTERVLDHVHAYQLDGIVYLPGVNQTKPMGHPPYELDHRPQQPGVGGDRDAGNLFLRRNLHLGQKKPFSTLPFASTVNATRTRS
jgi:hypothetical protein